MKKVQEDWKEEMLQVGVLTNTHGVRGEVKVYPTTDDVMRFKKLKQVFWILEKNRWSFRLHRRASLKIW